MKKILLLILFILIIPFGIYADVSPLYVYVDNPNVMVGDKVYYVLSDVAQYNGTIEFDSNVLKFIDVEDISTDIMVNKSFDYQYDGNNKITISSNTEHSYNAALRVVFEVKGIPSDGVTKITPNFAGFLYHDGTKINVIEEKVCNCLNESVDCSNCPSWDNKEIIETKNDIKNNDDVKDIALYVSLGVNILALVIFAILIIKKLKPINNN